MGNMKAPEGMIFLCPCCGKTSPWSHGWDNNNNYVADRGWDASCVMNCVLVEKTKVPKRGKNG